MTPTEEMPDSYRDRDEGLCCIDSGEGGALCNPVSERFYPERERESSATKTNQDEQRKRKKY